MKAIFFDRDGVINKDFGYVYEAKDFIFMDDIFDFLKFCKAKDFLLLLVTNQSGIGRGYYTVDDFKELTLYMQNELKKRLGFGFESIYFCPHSPDENCLCRKPKPGMLQKAEMDYKLDFQKCFIIGDKITDMQAGQAAGVKNKIFLTNGSENTTSIDNIYEISSIKDALKLMERLTGG